MNKKKNAQPVRNKREGMFSITMKRLSRNKVAMFCLGVIILMFLVAVFAGVIAPYGFEEQDLSNTLKAPSMSHLCGTDNVGRDIFSRLLYGSRNSLLIGFLSVTCSAAIGILIGLCAGYFGGVFDTVVMRALDVIQALPTILLAIAISAALGNGLINCIIALSISQIPAFSRMSRASCMNVAGQEYIEAAQSINARQKRILLKHVLPNAMSPLIVQFTMQVAMAIITSAGLSFIGLGVQPPNAEWGAMLSAGRSYIRHAPWMVIFPGIMIMIEVLSLNLLGDGLRDALDPRLKN